MWPNLKFKQVWHRPCHGVVVRLALDIAESSLFQVLKKLTGISKSPWHQERWQRRLSSTNFFEHFHEALHAKMNMNQWRKIAIACSHGQITGTLQCVCTSAVMHHPCKHGHQQHCMSVVALCSVHSHLVYAQCTPACACQYLSKLKAFKGTPYCSYKQPSSLQYSQA